MASPASHFETTTSASVIGVVSKVSIVPDRFSSERSRMVRAGRATSIAIQSQGRRVR